VGVTEMIKKFKYNDLVTMREISKWVSEYDENAPDILREHRYLPLGSIDIRCGHIIV
jgi:hypothetical protein